MGQGGPTRRFRGNVGIFFVPLNTKWKHQVRIITDPDSKRCIGSDSSQPEYSGSGCSEDCTSITPLVSSCSKPSDNSWEVPTNGYLLYRSKLTDYTTTTHYRQCRDRKEHFYLDFPTPVQHGTILVTLNEALHDQLPPFKIYGLENSGREEMIW